MIKRIFALITILCLVCTSVAFAEDRSLEELYEMYMSDVVDINRVYKYDLAAKKSEEAGGEVITHKNAVNTVLALKLMTTLSDGTFGEAGAVPLRDFAKMIMTLAAGDAAFENNYDDYPETRFTTQDEAAYYLVGVLGYDAYEVKYKGENPRSMVAREIKLFDGIEYSGSKNITRGELAQMLYNALVTNVAEQTSFGDTVKYEVTEGNTLVYNRYNSVIVRGIVTSQYGINIDSTVVMDDNTLAIDGAKFYIDSADAPDLLGHNACALAKIDEAGRYRLLFVDYDEDDATVRFNIDDVTAVRNGTVYYDASGNEKSVRVNRLSKIVVNGTTLNTTDLESVLFNYEGEVRICPENDTLGSFAYISEMDTFKVRGISLDVSERIFLAHGATYDNGNQYIEFAGKKVHVIRDGVKINLADIKEGSVISVIEDAARTELKIIVSDSVVTGTVEEINDDIYTIAGENLRISDCYNEFRNTDITLPEIKLGTSGDFYLDYTGKIVSFDPSGNGYRLGFLKGIGSDGGVLGGISKARIYTTDNEWKDYELETKITLDGTSGVLAKDAVDTIQNPAIDGTIMIENIIRYKLSGEGKIKLIDTAYVADEEQDDPDTIRHHGDKFVDYFNWTASSKGYKSIGEYVATSESKVFNIPVNVEDEEEFSFENSPTFSEGTSADLKMYNVSSFMVPDIIVRVKGSAASVNTLNHKILVVTKKMTGLNSDGDPVPMIECFDGSTTPTWKLRKFTVIESLTDDAQSLQPGDVLLFEATKDELTAFKKVVKTTEWQDDIEEVPGDSYAMGLGEVLDVDTERQHIRMRTGDTELTVYIHSLGMFDKSTGETYNLVPAEIIPGDRIVICGGYGYMRCLILRGDTQGR